uniref:Integrase catalytic domain-containing protein n=1 Tax=Graphocephala atropunctata TaxID=36148 RepID=A0A1B6KPY1_9HEMI
MQKIYMDVYGPLPKSSNQNEYILIMVDDFTKYNWVAPLRKVTSGNVLKTLENSVFKSFGLPECIVSDNAAYFTSEELRTGLFQCGVKFLQPFLTIPKVTNQRGI